MEDLITQVKVKMHFTRSLLRFIKSDFCICKSLDKCVNEMTYSYLSVKAYVMGAQKNHLNEMVLFGTQNICYH